MPAPQRSGGALHRAQRRRYVIMRPGLLLVTCPTDAGYRARLFLPIGSIALVEGTSLDPYRQDVRSPLPRRLAVFFLSGDAHESMTMTSVSDDARLAVRTLDDERGDRRKVLAKGGDSAALGLGDFVVRSAPVVVFQKYRPPDDLPLPFAGVRVSRGSHAVDVGVSVRSLL